MALKKAGIGIDPYKLKTFQEELTKAGFKYTFGDLTKDLIMIYIHFEEFEGYKLERLIRTINLKAKANKDQN